MKKKLIAASLLLISSYALADSSTAELSTTVNPSDPCTIVLCMAAKVAGDSGGSDCTAAEKVFFGTYGTKHHVFNPAKTLTKRSALLGQCPDGSDQAAKILSKFGRVIG